MTECGRCGACCQRIYLQNLTPEQIVRIAAGDEVSRGCNAIADATFILDHWHGTPNENGVMRYECDAYDAETRLCTAHDTRPPICRGFPWYDAPPSAAAIRPFKSCTFWLDIPIEEWPEGTSPE